MQELGPRVAGGSVEMLTEMVSSGYKGRKSGKGYFVYRSDWPSKIYGKFYGKMENKDVQRIIKKYLLIPKAEVFVFSFYISILQKSLNVVYSISNTNFQ